MASPSQRCPYSVLGVSRTSTKEEIKAAFRKLSKETHPDVANGCPERFKEVANAANILTDPLQRQRYDRSFRTTFARSDVRRPEAARSNFHHGLHHIFRPRNLVLYPLAFVTTVAVVKFAIDRSRPKEEPMVQAWKNPVSGNYETPAPWDPLYRKTSPTLEYVPRSQVQQRSLD